MTTTPVEFFFTPAARSPGAPPAGSPAVAEVELPEAVAAAVDDESLDATVRTEHEASQAVVGDTAGSPVVALAGHGFFGPVVVPVPTGEEALRLFEGVRLLAGVPAFSELKTARNPF